MTVGAIIQARMSSRRLPGKVLLPLGEKPILAHVVSAVQNVRSLHSLVVATSREASDDPIAQYCAEHHLNYFRGSLDNVAERFLQILEAQGWDAVVRVSADSPLIDWHLIEKAVDMFIAGSWDVVTNVFPRSYPHGQSVEVINAQTYRQAYPHFSRPEEFEHVTPYFYTHASDWRIGSIVAPTDQSQLRLAVDTPEDLKRLKKAINKHA